MTRTNTQPMAQLRHRLAAYDQAARQREMQLLSEIEALERVALNALKHLEESTHTTKKGVEKDAARYRWLRKSPNPACDIALAKHFGGGRGQDFDALIDAAIAAQAKHQLDDINAADMHQVFDLKGAA